MDEQRGETRVIGGTKTRGDERITAKRARIRLQRGSISSRRRSGVEREEGERRMELGFRRTTTSRGRGRAR